MIGSHRILIGDCIDSMRSLAAGSVRCCVTSPPYWGLRDYGMPGQLGLESTPDEYVAKMVAVFREVRRVLADDGTLWLNLGDSYTSGGRDTFGTFTPDSKQATHANIKQTPRAKQPEGLKPKDLVGIPWMMAFALRADGWYLRSDIIWSKPNPMPESVRDRPTKAHEYIFLLSKQERYYFDHDAIKEKGAYFGLTGQDESGYKDAKAYNGKHAKADKQRGHSRRRAGFNDRWDAMSKDEQCSRMRNSRSVWNIATQPFAEAHFATFPEELADRCVRAGSAIGDTVLDPFGGSCTVGAVACPLGRNFIGCELNPEYVAMAKDRIGLACKPNTHRSARPQPSALFGAKP